MLKQYLECGKIINKRGISGELKVECYCDSTSSINDTKHLYFDESGTEEFEVISIKEYKGFMYIKLNGIDSAEKADAVRSKILYVSRNDIKKSSDSYFIVDLIGLDVIDYDTGAIYGQVSDVSNYGASDIYTVTTEQSSVMIPAVKDIIISVDLQKGIFIKPIPGMFDDAEEIH